MYRNTFLKRKFFKYSSISILFFRSRHRQPVYPITMHQVYQVDYQSRCNFFTKCPIWEKSTHYHITNNNSLFQASLPQTGKVWENQKKFLFEKHDWTLWPQPFYLFSFSSDSLLHGLQVTNISAISKFKSINTQRTRLTISEKSQYLFDWKHSVIIVDFLNEWHYLLVSSV